MIKISVPNDDHVALRAMAKALEEIAVARGAPAQCVTQDYNFEVSDEVLKDAQLDTNALRARLLKEMHLKSQIDTTPQQVESLATHVITSQEKVGDPVDLGDGNFSQGYRIEIEELPTTDSTGTPWDERIHSASKALNGDGTWRLRRKPKDMEEAEWLAYVEEVKNYNSCDEEDLERLYPNGFEFNYEEVSDKAEPTVTPEGDDFHTDAGAVTEQQVASFPPPPLVPQVLTPVQEAKVAEVVAPVTMTFPQVMAFLTERHGRITSAQVDQIIADMGLEKITDLNTQPEHTGPFIARVKALLGE